MQPTIIHPEEPQIVTPSNPVPEQAQPVVMGGNEPAAPLMDASPMSSPVQAADPAPVPVPSAPVPELFQTQAQLSAYNAEPPAPAPARHFSALKFGVVALLLGFVIAGGFAATAGVNSVAQGNAGKTAKAFVAALNSGNSAKAYAMASAGLHGQQSESEFTAALGDLKSSNTQTDAEQIAFNGRDTATYHLIQEGLPPTDDGSTTGTYSISLVKSGLTGWKVDSVSVQ